MIIKSKIMIIRLAVYLAASGAIVSFPSSIESSPSPPRDERAELANRSLQGGEYGAKFMVDTISSGPLLLERIKTGERIQDTVSEGGAGGSVIAASVPPQGQPVRGEGDEKQPAKANQCDGYCGLYLSAPVWVMAFWIAISPLFRRPRNGVNARLRSIPPQCGQTGPFGHTCASTNL